MTFSRMAIMELHAGLHGCLDVLLDHMSGIPPRLLVQELTGFGRPTVRDKFAHILSTEAGWVVGLSAGAFFSVDDARGISELRLLRAVVFGRGDRRSQVPR